MPVGYGELGVTQDAHIPRQISRFTRLRCQEGGRFPASNQLIEESMDIAADPATPTEGKFINTGHLQHVRAVVVVGTFLRDAPIRIVISPTLNQL